MKDICTKIGYDGNIVVSDVRTIIFTKEFMEKLYHYCSDNGDKVMTADKNIRNIIYHLDDPVNFIYNLIKQ